MIAYLPQNYTLVHAFRRRPSGPTPGRRRLAPRIFKMAPKLQDFFPADEVVAAKGGLDRPFSGLTMDSRRVVPGNLFFALPGLRTDGAGYIDEAIDRGAVAVVTQRPVTLPHSRVTFIQVADARATLARVAQRYYRFPDRDLAVVGVTGTNGKTTVTHLLKHFLNGERRVGLIGTVSYDLGARTVPSYKTTPEALDIFGMLAQMRDAGCRQAVMEVSSHGIDQQRVLGLHFDAVVFTNPTPDSKPDDGLFDLVIVRQVSRLRIFGLIPHFMKGTQGTQPEVKTLRAARVAITAVSGALPAQSDGEIICVDGARLDIEMLPHQVEIVCPKV